MAEQAKNRLVRPSQLTIGIDMMGIRRQMSDARVSTYGCEKLETNWSPCQSIDKSVTTWDNQMVNETDAA